MSISRLHSFGLCNVLHAFRLSNYISSVYVKEIYGYMWNKHMNSAYVIPETAMNLIEHNQLRDQYNRQLFYVLQEEFRKFSENANKIPLILSARKRSNC